MARPKPKPQTERPSTGTTVAAKYRARINAATDAERSALFAKGMQLIYGNSRTAKTSVGSR